MSLSEIYWTSTCLLICIWVVNQRLSIFFEDIIKVLSILRKYFIYRYAFTSVQAMKKKKLRWSTRFFFQCTLQTNLWFISVIMPQGILIVHQPPISVMTHNNFRIIKLDYPPIHHPYLLLLTLCHSQTWNFWHHHNIVIRILKIKN